jgi:hypothetical protein
MSSDSPATILYSSDGYELAVINGNAIPANTRGILVDGSDGTNAHELLVDTSGRLNIVGAAAAGAASSGNPIYIGGSVTTASPTYTTGTVNALSLDVNGNLRVVGSGNFNNASVGVTAAAPPADATYVGALVTTAAESGLTTGDMYPLNLTTTGQLRIDGTYPLTTTVATAVDMTQVGGVVTTTAPTYATATINALSLTTGGLLRIDGVYAGQTALTATADTTFVGGAVTTSPPSYTTGQISALSLDVTGNLRVTGSGTAGSPGTEVLTVQGITGGTAIPVSGTFTTDKSSTATLTQVAQSTSSQSFLVANANRISATFYNSATTGVLYLAFAATATTTAYTNKLMPQTYYDLPIAYTGAVSGIWSTAGSGAIIITELT